MKTVWVVEQGNYSDYSVVGVFSSQDNAARIAALCNKPDSDGYVPPDVATVSEWPLDPAIDELRAGHKQYGVLMLKDGTVETCETSGFTSFHLTSDGWLWERSKAPAYANTDKRDCLNATVWASDQVHAIKITNERRIQMIANGEWP